MAIVSQYMNQSFEKYPMKIGNQLELHGLSLTELPFYFQVLLKRETQLKHMKLR